MTNIFVLLFDLLLLVTFNQLTQRQGRLDLPLHLCAHLTFLTDEVFLTGSYIFELIYIRPLEIKWISAFYRPIEKKLFSLKERRKSFQAPSLYYIFFALYYYYILYIPAFSYVETTQALTWVSNLFLSLKFRNYCHTFILNWFASCLIIQHVFVYNEIYITYWATA